jgi:hypothetical protein
VLGHGAGGGVGAPDLVLATEVANGLGIAVALVEQPYRVAGRRSTPAAHLLLLWTKSSSHGPCGPRASLRVNAAAQDCEIGIGPATPPTARWRVP